MRHYENLVQSSSSFREKSSLQCVVDIAYFAAYGVNLGGRARIEEKIVRKAVGAIAVFTFKAGSLKMNTALEYSTRVVQEGGRRCIKSTLNDLIHLTPLRIPLMNPPLVYDIDARWNS